MQNNKKAQEIINNINVIRPALVEARRLGNKAAISSKMCDDLGISNSYFKVWESNVLAVYDAVCAYVKVKNSPVSSEEERNAAMEPIFPAWKKCLSCGEAAKDERTLRVTEHDISNLVAHVSKFMDDAANVKLAKDFTAQKAWATKTLGQFRKLVETDIGIRIAGVEVLTDEQRDLLVFQTRKVSKIKKVQAKISEENARILMLQVEVKTTKSDDLRKHFEEQIKEAKRTIGQCEISIENLKKELAAGPEAEAAQKAKAKAETKTETKTESKKAAGRKSRAAKKAAKEPAAKVEKKAAKAPAKAAKKGENKNVNAA